MKTIAIAGSGPKAKKATGDSGLDLAVLAYVE